MNRKRLAIVGMPNVGKSVLFNALTVGMLQYLIIREQL